MTQQSMSRRRRLLGLTAALIVTASVAVTGPAAHAATVDIPISHGTSVGVLHLSPTSGEWSEMPTRVWTDTAFSAPVTDVTHPTVYLTVFAGAQSGMVGFISEGGQRNPAYTGPRLGPYNFGVDPAATGGNAFGPLKFEDYYGTDIPLEPGSPFSLVLRAKTDSTTTNHPEDRYFRADLEVTETGWKVVSSGPAKTATTTVLAASEVTQASAKLTATVMPAGAAGTVQFKNGETNVGPRVAVANGKAEYSATGLAAGADYAFTAEYSGDDTHDASTGSASVTTADVPAGQKATPDVKVNVPAANSGAAKGLQLTVASTSIDLVGGERVANTEWVATGSLGEVTVNDDRRDATKGDWSLNGTVSALKDGDKTIEASALGWKPSKTSGPDDVQVGPEVPSLAVGTKLASGKASAASNLLTKLGAQLNLKVPPSVQAGAYKGTLTLTLI